MESSSSSNNNNNRTTRRRWKKASKLVTYESVIDKRHDGVSMAAHLQHRLDLLPVRQVVRLQPEAETNRRPYYKSQHGIRAIRKTTITTYVPGGVPEVVGLVLGLVVLLEWPLCADGGLAVAGDLLLTVHLPHVVLHRLVGEVEGALVVLRVDVLRAEHHRLAVGEDADRPPRHEVLLPPERHRPVLLGVVVRQERHAHVLLLHLEHPSLHCIAPWKHIIIINNGVLRLLPLAVTAIAMALPRRVCRGAERRGCPRGGPSCSDGERGAGP